MSLVSIVTTVYNRDRYLTRAIESVLSQQYQDFEYIIWDDGSTDKSLDIAQYYASQDSRIKVVAADHQGRGISISEACKLAKGKYLGLVDSDDLIAVDCLTETVDFLSQNTQVDLVYTDYLVVDANEKVKQYGPSCAIEYSPEKLLTDFMIFHFRLMKRSTFEKVGGFDPAFECGQDYDLCLRLSEFAEIQHLKKPLYYYRQHTGSISFEKRVDQLLFGKQAIENAIKRRGLDMDFDLEFQIFARCTLYKKAIS